MKADVGLAKLDLKPGNVLLVTVPDDWSTNQVGFFYEYLDTMYRSYLNGAKVMVLSNSMRVFVSSEIVELDLMRVDVTIGH